ncbi:NTP transferase domain-containing protein [Pleionea sp. CnH1-48]|uniref:nucleotidyltransferase family protein n=1 Tax=Pleionea sp. CnH1-48 TaxID=2954494 RepID=UPI002096DCA7|nr:nucleotidyltransferase family protein [Pleionea sp. CnH1-48]MCO7225817.1 nucleotidyltransferase family protein [Pleionea sp. CnH1-48]
MSELSVVILAAGNSSRLGRPKQLLKYRGLSLIERACCQALRITDRVSVVTGASAENIADALQELPVKLIHNTRWQEGMGSSIVTGVSADTGSSGMLLMLCDQPLISDDHYVALVQCFNENPQSIIASSYKQVIGVPAIFPARLFTSLQGLSGATGARKIIQENLDSQISIDCPQAAIDIDVEADVESWLV